MTKGGLLLAFVAGAALYAASAKASASALVPGVRMATVNGREYEVFRRGSGTYEVVLRSDPSTFIILGQGGEIDAKGSDAALATMRSDMQRFPGDLFS